MAVTPSAVVGANVRAEMARKRITQTVMARKIGMSQASLSARLRAVTPFDVDELAATAAVLGVPVAALLAIEEVPA